MLRRADVLTNFVSDEFSQAIDVEKVSDDISIGQDWLINVVGDEDDDKRTISPSDVTSTHH